MKEQHTKFKQTEIGMIPEDWEEVVFSKVIDVNPYRELKKGSRAKYVSMDALEPFSRKIYNITIKEYKGGTKFKKNDTLFARITPCLENGKIAFVDFLTEGEVGFGSTEFIVLSAKENLTDPYFVYYLSRTPEIRKIAIKSMTGTSGRQRVENDIFDSIIVRIPNISEQTAIAKILSDLDAKIELNQQMNKTLEEIGRAIFKHWFVDFEFPNEEGKPYKTSGGMMVYNEELGKEIPKGWRVEKLSNKFYFINGIEPGSKYYNKEKKGKRFIRVGNLTGKRDEEIYVDI
ncbi:MAG: restriction endonuclease subunit S, partial [candidate division WOR-3 bacterium]